jgi:hypothetical protein
MQRPWKAFTLILLLLLLNGHSISSVRANGPRVYTTFELDFYQIDDQREIRDLYINTDFCQLNADQKGTLERLGKLRRLCREEENICREAFAHLKERLQKQVPGETFRLYGCGAEERHVPRQEVENALFFEYQLRSTQKAMFKQSVPFDMYVLRSFHKRWKDGQGYSFREIASPFPIPETEDWESFRQDIINPIKSDIDEVVLRVNWRTLSQRRMTLNIPKLSQNEMIYGMKAERELSKSSSIDPKELFDIYLKAKEAAQKGSGLRPNYLNNIEQFLQEQKLLDETLDHQAFIERFVDETIALHKNSPDKILSIYQKLKILSELDNQSEIPYLRLYEVPGENYLKPYESYLRKEGLLP